MCKQVGFICGNLFSKNNRTWEFIFEENGLFKISENKNLLKITSHMVWTTVVAHGEIDYTAVFYVMYV